MQPDVFPSAFKSVLGIKGRPFQSQYEDVLLERVPDSKESRDVIRGWVFRDSDGRERRSFLDSSRDEQIIFDPVSSQMISLYPETKIATVLRLSTDNQPYFSALTWRCRVLGLAGELVPEIIAQAEKLGYKTIEGLMCKGYRMVDHSGRLATEFWYSDELEGVIQIKSVGEGREYTWRLFNISRISPDAQVFTVPENYRIQLFQDP